MAKGAAMSEDAVPYVVGDSVTVTDTVPYCKEWLCENCGGILAIAVNGHVRIGRNVDVELGPASATVFCPHCEAANTWMFNERSASTT